MGVKFSSTFSASKTSGTIRERLTTRLGQAMTVAQTEILARTGQGKDVNEADFKAYSDKKYLDKKGNRINFITKKGKVRPLETYREYKLRKLGTALVNLTEKSDMLKAIQSTVEQAAASIRGRIFFRGDQENKARWNNATRRFFALSREQIERIKKTLKGI